MEKPTSAYQIRNKHSLCLGEHKIETADIAPIRNAQVLTYTKAPSLPYHVADQSFDLIQETKSRRQLHRNCLNEEPGGFKKLCVAESATFVLNERNLVRDMIGDLHQIRDPQDLNKNNRYTYSRVGKRTTESTTEHVTQDFLTPGDQTRNRTTGYNQGHIRSILGLDAFGPNSSLQNQLAREAGSKPPSPNIDRHSREGSRSKGSRASTASTRSGAMGTKQGGDKGNSGATNVLFVDGFANSIDISHTFVGKNKDVMAGTLGYYGSALAPEEKLAADTHFKGQKWFTGYLKGLEDVRDIKLLTQKMKSHRENMTKEAEAERRAIEQFEFRMESAKISSGV